MAGHLNVSQVVNKYGLSPTLDDLTSMSGVVLKEKLPGHVAVDCAEDCSIYLSQDENVLIATVQTGGT